MSQSTEEERIRHVVREATKIALKTERNFGSTRGRFTPMLFALLLRNIGSAALNSSTWSVPPDIFSEKNVEKAAGVPPPPDALSALLSLSVSVRELTDAELAGGKMQWESGTGPAVLYANIPRDRYFARLEGDMSGGNGLPEMLDNGTYRFMVGVKHYPGADSNRCTQTNKPDKAFVAVYRRTSSPSYSPGADRRAGVKENNSARNGVMYVSPPRSAPAGVVVSGGLVDNDSVTSRDEDYEEAEEAEEQKRATRDLLRVVKEWEGEWAEEEEESEALARGVARSVSDGADVMVRVYSRPLVSHLCYIGEVAAVEECLKSKRPIDFTTAAGDGCTFLHYVASCCSADEAERLLSAVLQRLKSQPNRDKLQWGAKAGGLSGGREADCLSVAASRGHLALWWRLLRDLPSSVPRPQRPVELLLEVDEKDWLSMSKTEQQELKPTRGFCATS